MPPIPPNRDLLMKVKLALLLLLVAACSAGLTWYLTKHGPTGESPAPSGTSGRRVLYYQSAMHPWSNRSQAGVTIPAPTKDFGRNKAQKTLLSMLCLFAAKRRSLVPWTSQKSGGRYFC